MLRDMLRGGKSSGPLPGQMHRSKGEKTQVDSDKGKGCLKGTHKHRLGGDPDEATLATIYLPAENRNKYCNKPQKAASRELQANRHF